MQIAVPLPNYQHICAVKGRPIVTPDWIETAAAAGSFTDPSAKPASHLLVDKAAEKEHSFDLARCAAWHFCSEGIKTFCFHDYGE